MSTPVGPEKPPKSKTFSGDFETLFRFFKGVIPVKSARIFVNASRLRANRLIMDFLPGSVPAGSPFPDRSGPILKKKFTE